MEFTNRRVQLLNPSKVAGQTISKVAGQNFKTTEPGIQFT